MSETIPKDEELFGPSEADEVPAAEAPAPEPQAETPAEAEAPEAEDDEALPGTITPATVAAMRRDWKAKAIRAEEQAKADRAETERLRRDLEEARRAPAPQPAAPQAQGRAYIGPPPDPNVDPVGYVKWQGEKLANERLNDLEEAVREKYGDVVDEALSAFEVEAARNPVLNAGVLNARNPWKAMVEWHKKHKAMREIGDDPAAFRTRVEEEIRAKVLAEMQAQAPVPARPAAPALPSRAPSLANATAVAGRDASTFTGESQWSDILPNNKAFGG